jgi:signal transduction histidine kinase
VTGGGGPEPSTDAEQTGRDRRRPDWRPLDRLQSIKTKLGVLVAASIVASAGLTWLAVGYLGWRARYGLTLAIVAGLAVTQVLAHGMTSPLRQMTAAARAMAAGRQPGPIRATSRDEVGELARAFVAMSADLLTADAQRRDLLANLAHELRTPVAALRAQLENLVDGVRAADGTALHEVLDEVERLGRLVDDLLGLARAEAGVMPLARARVPVAALAQDVAREVRAVRPGREVVLDVPADLVGDADAARLRQVFVNLVDNAARHAPEGGRVDVRCRADGHGGLVVEVTDDGPGIPRAEWDTVFERFRRGGSGTTGGTGLGLAIARWAVALHGGRIGVVPSPHGCRIRADLPAPPALPAPPVPAPPVPAPPVPPA